MGKKMYVSFATFNIHSALLKQVHFPEAPHTTLLAGRNVILSSLILFLFSDREIDSQGHLNLQIIDESK